MRYAMIKGSKVYHVMKYLGQTTLCEMAAYSGEIGSKKPRGKRMCKDCVKARKKDKRFLSGKKKHKK